MQTQVSLRPIYEPLLDWDNFTENFGSLHVVYKNYVLFFKSELDDCSEDRNSFQMFNLDSYELKEGKLKGNVPTKILDKGICLFDEKTIFVIGYSEESPQTEGLFLFSIVEDPQEQTLEIHSKVKYQGKDMHTHFTKIHSFYKHQDIFYVIGNRVHGPYSIFVRGFWKLDRRSGEWTLLNYNSHNNSASNSNLKKHEGFSSALSYGNFYLQGFQGKLFLEKTSHFWDLWELKHKKTHIERKKLKAGKTFSSKSWSTLGSYNENLYLFVGRPFDENAKEESGLYQYDKENDAWTPIQFRGVCPPKVGEHIFVPYKDSIFILSLNSGSKQIFRIIMDPSEHNLKRKNSLVNKELPDIILKVDGKEFPCHKAVLSDASHFFSSMFNSGMKECFDKELDIPDVKASTFEIFLRYIYDDEAFDIKEEFVRELYELSDRWLITGLHAECHEFLKRNLTLDNFGKVAEMAQEMDIPDLLEAATDFGLKNCGLLEEKHLESMSSSVLRKIICKCERIEVRKKDKKSKTNC